MDPTCCDSVAPPALTVQVCFPGVRAAVLDNLNRQREEGRLCDLSIQVQGQVFRAHRCVLAASSPYFHDQVLLKNVTTVSLPSVMDPVAFESVLSSAYTGQLSIIHDDIVNYVTVASFLQMWHIVDKCTEILKRPRPSGEAEAAGVQPGSASRQQSPSSTECLYLEREGRRRERKPDALPPLATWRRPQQALRWSRPRPPSEQHSADSQLDGLPGYGCQEEWICSPAKPDGLGQAGRHHGGVPAAEASKQKVRFQQRGAPQGRDCDETQERKRNVRRETEADEGVGDEEVEKKEGFTQMDLGVSDDGEDPGRAAGRQSVETMKDKVQRDDLSPHVADVCGPDAGAPGPSCPVPARLQFQSGSWCQQEQRRQEGEDEDEDDEVDLDCFSSYARDTYDEIEDGTGQVSQRPLLSPDFSLGASDMNWSSTSGGQGGALTPSSSSAACPPSPPTPSSSSSVSVSGAAYTGKVHFCHCGKAYTLKSMRDRHVKMQHLNLRPFGCPVCTKSFKMKHHLTKHLKTHGGLRPYECSLCGKKVIWRDSFLRHQARCERLASSGNSASAAVDLEDGYGFGFDDGEAFVPTGQVKVEEGEFQRDVGDGMGGLLPGMALGTQPQNLDSVGHVFKVEAAERFSET